MCSGFCRPKPIGVRRRTCPLVSENSRPRPASPTTMSLSSFFSSFLPTVYADAPADDKEESKPEESAPEESKDEESTEESKDEEAGGEEEEEEEEPEDVRSSHCDHC